MDFLGKQSSSVDLNAIAYTLQVGREAMEERLGLVVNSVGQLAEKLQAYVAGDQGIEDVYQGQVKRNKEALSLFSSEPDLQQAVDKWMVNRKLSKLLELWVKGLDLDWSKLYGETEPRRMRLPTYPFAQERYWIDTPAVAQVATRGTAAAVLHPLLHRNTSDLIQQRYSSTFTGEEFFLVDHQVKANGHGGQSMLPGVAYLEMARAAVEQAWPDRPQAAVLELRNTSWVNPRIVAGPKEVSIAVLANDEGQLGYEIYSIEAGQKTIHCHGQAVFGHQPAPVILDIQQLKGEMRNGKLESSNIYAMCAAGGSIMVRPTRV